MPDCPSPALHKAEQTDWGILQELRAKWAHHVGEGGCASGRKGWGASPAARIWVLPLNLAHTVPLWTMGALWLAGTEPRYPTGSAVQLQRAGSQLQVMRENAGTEASQPRVCGHLEGRPGIMWQAAFLAPLSSPWGTVLHHPALHDDRLWSVPAEGAVCPWSGNSGFPLKPGSLILVPE